MHRKRTVQFRQTSSSSSSRKFVSGEAEQLFESQFRLRAIIAERGFHNPGGRVEGQIHQRDWHKFAAQPTSACIGLVREFYSNAPERKRDNTIYVRGKWILFDSKTINRLYQLEDFEEDQYSTFRTGQIDYDEILNYLCGGEARVYWKRKGDQVSNFPASGLDSESKAWHYFITARLLPSGNTSEVTRERAVLNYCIQAGMSIDVGKIIFQSLLNTFQSVVSVGLGHPSLIHELCVSCGVEFLPSEEVLFPKTSITKSKIGSYSSRASSGPGDASSSQPPLPPSRGKNLSITEQVGLLRQEVHGLRIGMDEHNRWHKRQDEREERRERKADHNTEQQMMFYSYMSDYTTAQNLMYASAGLNVGPGRVQYPEPPIYSEYPDDEEEEEEQGGDFDD